MSAPSADKVTSAQNSPYVVAVSEEAETHRSDVVRLWQKANFGSDKAVERYDWFYRRKSPAPRLHMLRQTNSSELIGFLGIGPREWWIDGRRLNAGVLVDFIVLPEHRTLLPAMSLQRQARKWWLEQNPLLYALPNEKSALIFKRLGASAELELSEYVRLLRPTLLFSRHLPRWLALFASAVVAISSQVVLALQLRKSRLRAEYEEGFGHEFTELWQRLDKTNLSIGTRSADYLSWRFSEQPGRCYRTLVVRDSVSRKVCGYFVCETSGGVLYVRDFLIEGDLERRSQSLRLLARTALGAGMESVRITVSDVPEIIEALRAALFFKRGTRPVFYVASGEDTEPRRLAWFFTPADEDV